MTAPRQFRGTQCREPATAFSPGLALANCRQLPTSLLPLCPIPHGLSWSSPAALLYITHHELYELRQLPQAQAARKTRLGLQFPKHRRRFVAGTDATYIAHACQLAFLCFFFRQVCLTYPVQQSPSVTQLFLGPKK